MKKALLALSLLVSAASAFAEKSANLGVDWRGLPNVGGILRDDSKARYGYANFIAYGPGWQSTAQDYAAKEHKRSPIEDPEFGKGMLFTGKIWAGLVGIDIREEFFDVTKAGRTRLHVRWTISHDDATKPMNLENAFVRFPVSCAEFAGGRIGDLPLPRKFAQERIAIGSAEEIAIVSKDAKKRLLAKILRGNPVLYDARKDDCDRFELRIEFPDVKAGASSSIEFEIAGLLDDSLARDDGKVSFNLPAATYRLAANDEWCEFPFSNAIRPGSILDFSKLGTLDAPAGKYGFAKITADGHLAFEQNGKPIRLVGGNLCFDANFPPRGKVESAVADFVRRGWNAIRIHHADVTITRDEWNRVWNRTDMPELSPTRVDQLDYLVSKCKQAGIYLTFDLYSMGALGSCEGMDGKPLNYHTVRAWVPIHKPAEDLWFKRAMELFDHVNPHTGVAWKDEPAILFVGLMNEDSLNSCWQGAADVYVSRYNEWAAKRNYPKYERKAIEGKREFAEFLQSVKAEANRRMAKRLRDAGVRALITGGNWWDTMQQTYERDPLDVVSNHGYGDCPQPSYQRLPFHVNQTCDVSGDGNGMYNEPVMKAPGRILGKPFVITEYNYCVPNRWRADGGIMMGAYASLQDWDGVYRFAWSHGSANMFAQCAVNGFDIATDPVGQLTDRQVVLMYGRRDVKPAQNTYGYGVTKGEAFEKGVGDMWAKGLFPQPFTALGYTSRIGSYVADEGAMPKLACTKTWSAANRRDLPRFDGDAVSDTKEIFVSLKSGAISVNAERTAAVCSCKSNALSAGPLSVAGVSTFCSVSASSMDGNALANSKRVLIFHITNVLNANMEFADAEMKDVKKWGTLPYLAKTGKAEVVLENSNADLTLYAVASDGSRLRKIPAGYSNGAYHFTTSVAAGEGENAPTMVYELSN